MASREGSMTPLTSLPQGARAVVTDLVGGHAFQQRVASMGLQAGYEIRVLQNHRRGPMLIAVGDTRLALGRGMARKVFVESATGSET
jgi:ferrous iron transport protein A